MMYSMLQAITALVTLCVTALGAVIWTAPVPAALATLADTERAFARLGYETNFRDAFLQYFADDATDFDPTPGSAIERLKAMPAPSPDIKLWWEPRVGDIAGSGELGYLTGPTETRLPGQPVRHGTYFSVWKKQADGRYKVILDVGVRLPGPGAFDDGFVRAGAVAAYKGSDTKAQADASLLDADKALSSALAAGSVAAAYRQALHPLARVHRMGAASMTTREAALAWLGDHVAAMTTTPMKSESAMSRDLGYTWGAFTSTTKDGAAEKGYYVRVWTRSADGTWLVAADITQPSRP